MFKLLPHFTKTIYYTKVSAGLIQNENQASSAVKVQSSFTTSCAAEPKTSWSCLVKYPRNESQFCPGRFKVLLGLVALRRASLAATHKLVLCCWLHGPFWMRVKRSETCSAVAPVTALILRHSVCTCCWVTVCSCSPLRICCWFRMNV